MMIKTRALVLRSIKYSDQKVIVDMFTEQQGCIACAVKVSASARGKLKRQLFHPLMLLDIELEYRQNRQLQSLHDAHLAKAWTELNIDPVKMTVGMFLAEVLYHAIRHEQRDTQLFAFITAALDWFDTTIEGTANFHLIFLIQLTSFLGIDLRHADDSYRFSDLLNTNFESMSSLTLSRVQRQQWLDLLLDYYRHQIPSFPELKSLPILQEVFNPQG